MNIINLVIILDFGVPMNNEIIIDLSMMLFFYMNAFSYSHKKTQKVSFYTFMEQNSYLYSTSNDRKNAHNRRKIMKKFQQTWF